MSARDDLNALLNGAIDVATHHLESSTEFLPFGLALEADGDEIFHIEPDPEGEDPSAMPHDHVIAALRMGLADAVAEGRWSAVAICADVTLEAEDGNAVTSAIHIMLEHRDEEPVQCTVAYAIGADSVELADLVAEPGETHLFKTEALPN
ncbi:MAG TPA: hypothetical protein ENK57_05520 [Polyangiaceae bacterium]|nr:hypothetical protein [Polyangiaceae bacterium]